MFDIAMKKHIEKTSILPNTSLTQIKSSPINSLDGPNKTDKEIKDYFRRLKYKLH